MRAWLLAFLLLGVIRFVTIAPDAWHWDEVLLADAVAHGIDLREHRPHPPGYPLLVEAATLLHRAGVDPSRSLAIVGTIGGLLAAAALAAFLTTAGLEADFACLGGVLYAFIPSVWLFGVRGFSDAPAAAAIFAAGALFLAGVRFPDGRLTALGIVLASLAGGFRPQGAVALLPLGLVSIIVCLRKDLRSWKWLLAGLAAGATLSVAVWAPAVAGSGGPRRFLEQIAIQTADTRRNVLKTPADLLEPAVRRRWLVDPFGWDPLFWAYALLAAIGAVRRPRFALLVLAAVAPWALLNVPASALFAAPRYATLLLGGLAGLAACGLEVLSRRSRWGSAAAGAVLAGCCAAAAVPPVVEVATRKSPPVAAIEAAGSGSYARGLIAHDPELRMHVSRLLPARERSEIADSRAVVSEAGDVVLLAGRLVPGLTEEKRFSFGAPLLARVSQGELLSVQMGIARAALSVGTRPSAPDAEVIRYGADIPVSIDRPAEGDVVGRELVVAGWCQLRGGAAVAPVEFRIDGTLVQPGRLDRTARPDVASVIPGIGDASRAGYEAHLDVSGLSPGAHVVRVTFRASDGRRRISHPVPFTSAR
jgi:hypothetical protein